MLHWKSSRSYLTFLVPLLVLAGCSQEPPKPQATKQAPAKPTTKAAKPADGAKSADGTAKKADGTDAGATKKVYRPPQTASVSGPKETIKLSADLADDLPAVMPKVLLTTGHAATCLVNVGDKFPDAELADLDGKRHKLSQMFGSEYTVVMLWKPGLAFAREELSDLPDFAAIYGNRGVKIVGVCVGATAQQARKDAQEAGVSFPILLDAKGELLCRIATEKLPRTYLLDSTGKILWFDIEYSRTTRRELRQALRFLLPKDATASAPSNNG